MNPLDGGCGIESGVTPVACAMTPSRREPSYSRKPRRVELREQLRWPLAEIAKNKVIGEVVDEDPDRWSQSSTSREYKMKSNFF